MSNIVTVQLKQTSSIKEFIAYSTFDTSPYTNRKDLAINLDVTKQELDSLFNTKKYERPYLPEYYNPLEELIGELWTDDAETKAIHSITEKVNLFIPTVVVDNTTNFSLNSTTNPDSYHTVIMELIFYYKNDFNKVLYNYSKKFNMVM